MALDPSLTTLSQRFQVWLIAAMAPLAVALAVLWLWGDAILDPLVQLWWVVAAILVCLLAALVVQRTFTPEGRFCGWRRLLGAGLRSR